MKKKRNEKLKKNFTNSIFTFDKAQGTAHFSPTAYIHNFLIFKKNICLYVDKFTTRASVNILG